MGGQEGWDEGTYLIKDYRNGVRLKNDSAPYDRLPVQALQHRTAERECSLHVMEDFCEKLTEYMKTIPMDSAPSHVELAGEKVDFATKE
jgi:hypothetical protein